MVNLPRLFSNLFSNVSLMPCHCLYTYYNLQLITVYVYTLHPACGRDPQSVRDLAYLSFNSQEIASSLVSDWVSQLARHRFHLSGKARTWHYKNQSLKRSLQKAKWDYVSIALAPIFGTALKYVFSHVRISVFKLMFASSCLFSSLYWSSGRSR